MAPEVDPKIYGSFEKRVVSFAAVFRLVTSLKTAAKETKKRAPGLYLLLSSQSKSRSHYNVSAQNVLLSFFSVFIFSVLFFKVIIIVI